MSRERDVVFLKVAVRNRLLTSEQAKDVLASRAQPEGVTDIRALLRDQDLLTEAQIAKIDGALSAANAGPGPSAPAPRPRAPRSSMDRESTRGSRRQYRSIFTKVGLGVGVAVSLIFVLVALAKNQGADEAGAARAEDERRQLSARDDSLVQTRIDEWKTEREKQDQLVLERVRQIERNAKTDRDRLLGLNNLLTQQPEAHAAPQVVARIDAIRGSVKADQTAGAEGYFERARALHERGKLWGAVLELDGMPNKVLKTRSLKNTRDELISEYEGEIDERYRSDIAKVKELRDSKDYQQAIDILERVKDYADPDTVRDSEEFHSEISQQLATYQDTESKKTIQKETAKYASFVSRYQGLCQDRNFKECISRALELDIEMTSDEVKKQLEFDIEAFEKLDRFIRDARKSLQKKIGTGEEVTLKLKTKDTYTGSVAKVESDQVTLTLERGGGSVGFPIPYERVTDSSFFALVEDLHGPRSADYLVPLSILFVYRGELSLADEHLRLAREAGHEELIHKWVEKLEWMRRRGGV